MLSFRHFLSQDNGDLNIPVVSISESVSINVDELNDAFDFQLNENLNNPYTGWLWSSKILESVGIELPKVLFTDSQEGVEVVELNINESHYYFYYEYNLNESKQYETFASIVTESELEELLEEE